MASVISDLDAFEAVLFEYVDGPTYSLSARLVEDGGIDSLTFTGLVQELDEVFECGPRFDEAAKRGQVIATIGQLRQLAIGK